MPAFDGHQRGDEDLGILVLGERGEVAPTHGGSVAGTSGRGAVTGALGVEVGLVRSQNSTFLPAPHSLSRSAAIRASW